MNAKGKNVRKITYRQMMALDVWLKTGRKSKAAALREAGYGKSIIRRPHKVFDSPAVLRELEMRGLDSRGMRNELQEMSVEEVAPKETIHIDFSKASKEWLQDLKERLAEIPDPPTQPANPRAKEMEIPSYIPKGDGVDILNGVEKHTPRYPYSSMG